MHNELDAAKIKRWREERGWSQEHLADAADVGIRTIQRIEKGEKASRESVMALAAAFDVDVTSLAIDARKEAEKIARRDILKSRNALRLSFLVSFASYIVGMLVFAGISLGDGQDGYAMMWPTIWWTVGVVAHGLIAAVFELVTYQKQHFETAD